MPLTAFRARGPGFSPKEVLFASTTRCNLRCAHCAVERGRARLSFETAARFLRSGRKAGLERVGFTGGEPFLNSDFLCAVTERALELGYLFGLVTTNGCWFRTAAHLRRVLSRLYDAGYDGSFAVSVDAFHGRAVEKPARFIAAAVGIWRRPDIIRLVAVRGARDGETGAVLERLAKTLEARLVVQGGRRVIKNGSLFAPVTAIDLSPVGAASRLVEPWGRAWFKDDRCAGPGQVLYVLPNGSVKPCCGYATDSGRLTIGNIRRDSAARLLRNAAGNPFVRAVYGKGLSNVRRCLERKGIIFPGAASNQCFFCHHVLTEVPGKLLEACLS